MTGTGLVLAAILVATLATTDPQAQPGSASATANTSPVRVGSVRLDQYGGLLDLPSPSGATGFFRTEKFGNRWLFVDPDGNAFWMTGVFAVDGSGSVFDSAGTTYNKIIAAKYGNTLTWTNQTINRLKSWGFNTIAEYQSTYFYPERPSGAKRIPVVAMMRPSAYGLTNNGNYAPGPFKNLMDCLGQAYTGGYKAEGPPDVFDPNFDAYVSGWLKAKTQRDWKPLIASPWLVGVAVDDADNLAGFGPGTEVRSFDGVVHVHIGWLALAVSPTKASSSRHHVTYSDPTVYTKRALRDFLYKKYSGNISALNNAWGSNYTTFDSNGGWGVGSGLMDEDGRHTAWLGASTGALLNATPGVTADLDAFLYQYADKYFSIVTARLRQYVPNHLVFGPASLNGHAGLTRRQVLRAAGKYLDVVQAQVYPQQLLQLTAKYVGDKPIVSWEGNYANPDSGLFPYPNPTKKGVATQAERGQYYAARVNYLLSTPSRSGTLPVAGLKWWAWLDSAGERTNWGLVTFRDNAYDGREAVISTGVNSWGYPTGGEQRNYGNFIGAVRAANEGAMRTLIGSPVPPKTR